MAQRFNMKVDHSGGRKIHVVPDTLNLPHLIGHRFALAARAHAELPADTFILVKLVGIMWDSFERQGGREIINAPPAADIFSAGDHDTPAPPTVQENGKGWIYFAMAGLELAPGEKKNLGYHSQNNPTPLILGAPRVGFIVSSHAATGGGDIKDAHDKVTLEAWAVLT